MEQMVEFEDPETPLNHQFCVRMTQEEYEEQTAITTHTALENLMNFVEKNPELYKKFLARKKLANEENNGILSYIKVKVLTALHGEDYGLTDITTEECETSINNFQHDVISVFNYAQESNTRRFSKRLAERKRQQGTHSPPKQKKNNIKGTEDGMTAPPPPPPPPPLPSGKKAHVIIQDDDKENIGSPSRYVPKPRPSIRGDTLTSPSVPPAPPLPPLIPLQDSTNKCYGSAPSTPDAKPDKFQPLSERKPRRTQNKRALQKTVSMASIGSIHDELRSFDRGSLRSIIGELSVDETPFKTPRTRHIMSTKGKSDSIESTFNIKMLDKFKNVRTPPSKGNSPANIFNTSGFTP